MATPTIGRIVHYRLTAADAAAINKWREEARKSGIAAEESGAVVHYGNLAHAGETVAMTITAVFGAESDNPLVNGQCTLDGNDTYWATSRERGDDPGQWQWPFLVDEHPPKDKPDGEG